MYFLRAAHRSARLWERGKQVITYRSIQPSDCAELGRIIVDTWQFDQFTAGPKGAGHFGQSYLLSCLLQASYTCVALREGRPVGVIVGAERRRGTRGMGSGRATARPWPPWTGRSATPLTPSSPSSWWTRAAAAWASASGSTKT